MLSSIQIRSLMVFLFVASGCAALIYELVWFQMLALVIGSTAVSVGVLLGTFMGGMCVGSLALSRFVSSRRHPLRVYAGLEAGTAVFGLLILFFIPYAGGLSAATALIPPTVLMGATLPAIARGIKTSGDGITWLGFFYGGNITGAVLGSLLAGFYLLRVYDSATATYVAVAINLSAAALAWLLAGNASSIDINTERSRPEPGPGKSLIYSAIAISGMTALGAEVVWTRLLSLMLGGSVYTLSIILAVFLVGLGIGSTIGSIVARRMVPQLALGICELLLIAAIAWSANMITRFLPYWPVDPFLSVTPWFTFQMDVFRAMLAILPAAILWGAAFPLALGAAAPIAQGAGTDAGNLMGRVYAANTIGGIAGALGFSLVIISRFGTSNAESILIGLSSIAASLVFASLRQTRWIAVSISVAIAGMAIVPPVSGDLVAYGRFVARNLAFGGVQGKPSIAYVGEGLNASVAVSTLPDGARHFHVSGRTEASTEPQDMRLQRMLGHISALNHLEPQTVLIVGFGSGMTAGTFVLYPSVKKIVICEIEPLIPQVVSKYFSTENYDVLNDPRTEVVYDDARHYLRNTNEKFDVITSDPVHPWIKGAAALYTQEYFELARRHLNPGGVVSQWVPLYESSLDVVKSEIATFTSVFPQGVIWGNDVNHVGYDLVLLGKEGSFTINVDEMHARLNRPDHVRVAQSLTEVGFKSVVELLATYAGRGPDLTIWLSDAAINRDRNLRLQYLAGMGLNRFNNEAIYNSLLTYRTYPKDLFIASEVAESALKNALGVR